MNPFDAFRKPFCDAGAFGWLVWRADAEGKIVTSLSEMGEAWGWNRVRVMRLLDKLEKAKICNTKRNTSGTSISLLNREIPDENVTPECNTSQPDLFAAPKGARKAKRKGHRLSPEWEPHRETIQWAVSQGLSENEARREAEVFRDYWSAQPGQRGVKVDWPATWRNWIRRKVGDGQPKPAQDFELSAYAAKYDA